jgi:hypothetical protein
VARLGLGDAHRDQVVRDRSQRPDGEGGEQRLVRVDAHDSAKHDAHGGVGALQQERVPHPYRSRTGADVFFGDDGILQVRANPQADVVALPPTPCGSVRPVWAPTVRMAPGGGKGGEGKGDNSGGGFSGDANSGSGGGGGSGSSNGHDDTYGGGVLEAMVGVLEQLPPDALFITGSTQQPVLARFRQYTRELFTAAYILAAAEDKESLLAAETAANAYGIASGRSLNQNTTGVMGQEWLVGATGHVYLFVVTPRLAGGAAMLPLVHELRVLLASDEGTAGRRAIVGGTRRELGQDVHSLGESAFQLGTDAWALGMARPPLAVVAQPGRRAGTVYDARQDSERLAALCTYVGDTSVLVHAIHLQRCPRHLNGLLTERAPWLPHVSNSVFPRLQVLARGGAVRIIPQRGARWQHGNGQAPRCRECGTTSSSKWRCGYTLCQPCGCRLWRRDGAIGAPAVPPVMSSAPPEAAALVEAIAAIERGGAVPPRPLPASTAAAVAASRASVAAARAAALATSAATLASAPPLVVVGSVPRRAPSWLRERFSQPLIDPLDDLAWPPLVGAALLRAVLRRASAEGEKGAAAVASPPADAACDDAFSLADALAWSEQALPPLLPPAEDALSPASLLAARLAPVCAALAGLAGLRGRSQDDALAAVAPLALTNLVEIEAADAGPPLRLARVEAFAAGDAANDSRWHDEILPPIAAHLHEAGRSGLLFVMTYGNGGGCTFKVVARTRSGALVDFILAAASRATTGGGSAAAVQPRPSRAALMIAGALGVELEELLLDRGGTGLPRKLVYLEQIRCRLRASPVRLAPSLLPFLFVSRADRSGSGARLRHLAAGMWPRKGGAAGREHAARCRGMPTAVVYEQRAHALPWSASSDNAAAGRLADASLQTAAAAIDFELVYASAAAADGMLLPPPRTAAVVARGSALIAVAGAVPEDDALLALLYEGRPVCGAR